MMELLKTQEYYELPTTKRLIAMCRKHIVDARMKLSTNRKRRANGQRNDLLAPRRQPRMVYSHGCQELIMPRFSVST